MPAAERVGVVDLDEYRRRRQTRNATADSSPSKGLAPMAWCYVWMMIPYGYPVGSFQA
jgi:hypothetical protein